MKTFADDRGSHLLVIDDGPGVPKDQRDRIFEAYERGTQTPGLTHSLGLGLYLSRMLAQRMEGDVTYRRDNEKTIFDLTLPSATD
jgi:signal transduction histidine kinase